jgi:hypothetical protein
MKTILLAVEGMDPNRYAIDYALKLCKPVRAGLDILQIVRPSSYTKSLSRFKKKAFRARDLFEEAMVAATYAEAGAPQFAETLKSKAIRRCKRLIPKDEQTAVDYHCIVTGDQPDAVLERYVKEHRSVILAIYDSIRCARSNTGVSERPRCDASGLLKKLSVPLVLVKNDR